LSCPGFIKAGWKVQLASPAHCDMAGPRLPRSIRAFRDRLLLLCTYLLLYLALWALRSLLGESLSHIVVHRGLVSIEYPLSDLEHSKGSPDSANIDRPALPRSS
jgi:hypothetical protein